MKFQKTLLAVALAISAVAVNAADPVTSKTPVYQYGKTADLGATDVIYKINDVAYTLSATEGFVKFEGDVSQYTNLLRGGLVDSTAAIGKDEEDTFDGSVGDVVFASNWKDTVVSNPGAVTSLDGTITAPEAGTGQNIDADIVIPAYAYLKKTEYQDFVAGNIGENLGVGIIDGVATFDKNNNLLSSVESGSALTSKGLGLVHEADNLNPNVVIDFEKGLVTETTISGGTVTSNQEVKAYGTGTTIEVIEVGGKFYSVGKNGTDLTEFTGDTTGLASKLIGAGAANGFNDSKTEIKTTEAFVGAQQTTYGESTVSFDNANSITVGNADVNSVLEAGKQYAVTGTDANRIETAQSVTTGIIASEDGKNTYGLVVSQTETGKADAYTTVTANGIETTGDVTIFAGSDKQTTVGSFIETAKAAIEANVDEKVAAVATTVETGLTAAATDRQAIRSEVETGLTAAATDRQVIRSEFAAADTATLASANAYTDTQVVNVNSRVNQLNSRVDDVEKTAYRGVAIALAAQQQIPNIGAGQFAVFGGVGHYEGESAGALGVASVFADGRTSVSAALGFAGGNEVGGRVGVSYVFGGK
ncbi:YadA C-terminal domain-containing protein [Acinetobacter sp. YH12105]|uniref:YadA C-terminal domain-containing protein n=1 Tax=Acinetobacter sp. YH12105 TaxID=2601093 RepID=UPI0015D1EDD5|nr:YadA C-terminal domain-containing protein [Acinetobacter sp. YH12105]